MYVPNTALGIEYAKTTLPVSLNKAAIEKAFNGKSAENEFVLAFMKEVVDYAKIKYAGQSILIELETYMMSLYAPHYERINNDVLIIDGEPVTFDPVKEELTFIR
jgi:hypothetical protein